MSETLKDFYSLTPEQILNSVEESLDTFKSGPRATGRLFALNSIENRVYQIEFEDGADKIAKFYRPSRWNAEQILEEHAWVQALHDAEIPVASPIVFKNGKTLDQTPEGILYAVFLRLQGRMNDEPNNDELAHLGRFLGRLHNVGRNFKFKHRLPLSVERLGREPLNFLLNSRFLTGNMKGRYQNLVESILKQIEPLFKNIKTQVIHGDCHLGNVLWGSPFGRGNKAGPYFVDFDDSMVGPVVQDLWMINRGREPENELRRDVLLSGYVQMSAFDSSQLKLVEPLRALRMIHYSSWIAKRWDDPSFPKMFPLFGTEQYWQEELEALEDAGRYFF